VIGPGAARWVRIADCPSLAAQTESRADILIRNRTPNSFLRLPAQLPNARFKINYIIYLSVLNCRIEHQLSSSLTPPAAALTARLHNRARAPEGRKQSCHIGWQGTYKVQDLTRARVLKAQFGGMESLSL
jgi:hypothetical protein